jgi:hypothetical protein
MKTLTNDPNPPTPSHPTLYPTPTLPPPFFLPQSRSQALFIKGVKEANDREYNGLQSLT